MPRNTKAKPAPNPADKLLLDLALAIDRLATAIERLVETQERELEVDRRIPIEGTELGKRFEAAAAARLPEDET